MRDLLFESILVADISEKKAKYVEFVPGFNVITSSENHVGKSSITKALYYALGAEVEYDSRWDKAGKIYILRFKIGDKHYKIVRKYSNFAVFESDNLVLLTDSVSRDLSSYLSKELGFRVCLPNKTDKKHELAPPVFTYLPYYIDQDKGWGNEPYQSFLRLEQYKKRDREASLYYHLGVYNEWSISILAQIDENLDKIQELIEAIEKEKIAISALQRETSYIVSAECTEELEANMAVPKERISSIVAAMSDVRSELQVAESMLIQYEKQLAVIRKYDKAKVSTHKSDITTCPNCGFVFDDSLYSLVREKYRVESEEFVVRQIELLINKIKTKHTETKEKYVALYKELENEEKKARIMEAEFDAYVKHKGLKASMKSMQSRLADNLATKEALEESIKELRKQLKDLPNKEEVDQKYAELLHENLTFLGAWENTYEGKLKILQPLKGQGTLSNKIILAQYISLFMTMDFLKQTEIPRLPFVVDSPRGKEASKTSSKDILDLIFKISSLPQIILVTIDFDEFNVDMDKVGRIIRFSDKFHVLQESDFREHEFEVTQLYDLLENIK